jgi:tRNA (cmo5U34)-methyltransferase
MKHGDNQTPFPASQYDAGVERTIPYIASFHEETLHLVRAALGDPERWLDTGCGTGTMVTKALAGFPATQFFLADPSAAMLEQARIKLQTGGPSRVHFLPATSSQDLAGELDSSFDVVTAIQCHHYLDRTGRRAAVGACYRVLKPGGLFLAFENVRPRAERSVEIGKRYWEVFQIRQGKAPQEAADHLQRFDREYFPLTVQEHFDLLEESGFETADIFWYSYLQAGFLAIK